ncbi:MAG: hypothetical protein JXB46_11390 [Candidatus Eisenbacteria bacterium]|nr:hypothetical protein [Candidatus Eisenbacteria bacterium]
MVRRMTAVILIASLLTGCGPRRIPLATPVDVDSANERLGDRSVIMGLEDGIRMRCERAVVALDTCTCVEADAGAVRRVPSSSAAYIAARRPGRGMLWGALVGLGAGWVPGLVSLGADDNGSPFAGVVVLLGLTVGGSLGLVFGPLTTSDIYEFEDAMGGSDENRASDVRGG